MRYDRKHDYFKAFVDAELSDTTRRIYLERWKVMLEHLRVDVFTILTQPKKYIAWIMGTYESKATQKSYMSAVLAVFRHNQGLKDKKRPAYEAWYSAFQEVHEELDQRYRRNEPTSKQLAGFVPFDEIVKKRDELAKGSDGRLLLSMYTYIPPLRCDFNAVQIIRGRLDTHVSGVPNYILFDAKDHAARLVLNEFKTSKKISTYTKELPLELLAELEDSLHRNPREHLFEDRGGKPYRASSFTRWANRTLQRVFGRPLTVSLIRHSFINSLDFNKLTVEEKENIARDMTHTVGTQDRYRLIFGA